MTSFRGFAVRLHIPVETLGRLRVPSRRHLTRWGYVRLVWSPSRDKVLVTLEDREGLPVRFKDVTQVRAISRAVGTAACLLLMRHNKYEPGEHPGQRGAIIIPSPGNTLAIYEPTDAAA